MNNRVPPHPGYPPANRSPEDYVSHPSPMGPPPNHYGGPTPPEFHPQRQWEAGYYASTSHQPVQPPQIAQMRSQQKVQMWQNSFITDSGVQTSNQSRATSMMSSLHARSHMSTSTVPGELPPELTEEQQMKFQNIHNTKHLEARDQLIPLLADDDDLVAEKAVLMVQHIAKKDTENLMGPAIVNRQVVESLKNLIRTKSGNEKIVRIVCCTLFHISSRDSGLEHITSTIPQAANFFADLVTQTRNGRDTSLFKYTLMTLHTIVSHRKFETRSLSEEKRIAVLETIVAWLDFDVNEKVLAIVVDTMKNLVRKNDSMKKRFVDLRGLQKIMRIITNSSYANLLQRAIQMVKSIAQVFPNDVVEAGAFSALPKHLSHPSQELVMTALECIRGISHVNAPNTSEILKNTVRLLGTADKRIELLCVGILSNMVANNQQNKELFAENNAIAALIHALHVANHNGPCESLAREEEIQERILATVQNLCSGHRHDKKIHAQIVQPEVLNLLLFKLTQMRPAILKQVLMILNKVLTNPSNVQYVVNCHLRSPQGPMFLVDQICHILKTACNQISTGEIEDVKVVDLIWLPLSVLQHMSVDRNLICSICACLRRPENSYTENNPVFLPIFALHTNDERVQRASLGLISLLVQHPEICQMLKMTPQFLEFVRRQCSGCVQALAAYATTIIKRLELGGDQTLLSQSPFSHQSPPVQPYSNHSSQPPSGYSTPPNRVSYPQPVTQFPQPPLPPPQPSYNHVPQYPEPHPPPPYGYHHQNQPMPMDSGYSNQPPPHMNRNNQYHEDMSNLSINDEPLANVFCPGSNDYGYNSYPNQQGYGNPSSHPQIMRCDYGSPADSSVPMGSPETDANDPCWMSPP